MKQSAPDAYFRDEDCRYFNYFVCELNVNEVFNEPAEGNIYDLDCIFLSNGYICSEKYIHSPNYPNDYPNNYDQVMVI